MATRTRKAKVAVDPEPGSVEPAYEQIALRAYEIHVSRAGGDPVQDWLRAEEELRAELAAPIARAA